MAWSSSSAAAAQLWSGLVVPGNGDRPIVEHKPVGHRRRIENVSERLLDQRLRNRIMEEILGLAEWERSLQDWGFTEYFESFFDFFPYEGTPLPNEAMTEQEQAAVAEVHRLMIEAMNATPRDMTTDQLIANGWPRRIEPVAARALRLMVKRGRFSEDLEEAEPAGDDAWPWSDRFAGR